MSKEIALNISELPGRISNNNNMQYPNARHSQRFLRLLAFDK